MSLSEEAKTYISEEENSVQEVVVSLKQQLASNYHKLNIENQRARQLTSKLTNATRDDDKQLIASDEAVSHQLAKSKKNEVRSIDSLIEKPYFARIRLQEGSADDPKIVEYKLGTRSNIDCRIIDWRNAPLAKLFYEYQEGEEYEEIIQGRERIGKVVLKNKVEISKSELKSLSCRHGKFIKKEDSWVEDTEQRNFGKGGLQPILKLITAEQFRLITEDSESAVLLQGVAGSGKTTLALHRLAWLLHENNSDATPEDALVIVVSNSLRRYIEKTLPQMGIEGVPILTFSEWAREIIAKYLGSPVEKLLIKDPPPWIARIKRSTALLDCINELDFSLSENTKYQDMMLDLLSHPSLLIEKDKSKLLDRETIARALDWTKGCFEEDKLDYCDLSLFLKYLQIKEADFLKSHAQVSYLVADEVQDLSPIELGALLGIVEKASHLTLVGDTAQQIVEGPVFEGWDSIKNMIRSSDASLNFTTLNLSHRCSLPIMRLADHVHGQARTKQGRAGKKPIWFVCQNENQGVAEAVEWLKRVTEKYPQKTTAVVCADLDQAKYVMSILEPTFGMMLKLNSDDGFVNYDGISVTYVGAAKGLEFSNVLIWNPSRKSYPAIDLGRNALYTAVSRAAELLCLVTWGRYSRLLPYHRSSLVRAHVIREDS